MSGRLTAEVASPDAAPPDRADAGGGEEREHDPPHVSGRFWPLALGAVGVVFGDIGTSPIYAFRLALAQAAKAPVRPDDILGVVSLALWALILVVTVKYVLFLMRMDNRGEGGVLSLMALAERAVGRRTPLILVLGLTGAALFYGDAVITPAMSVLSSVEGLRSIPRLGPHITDSTVLVVSLGLLLGLFAVQAGGTGKMGAAFGPITVLWFVAIAAFGLPPLLHRPEVLLAISPHEAAGFMLRHGLIGFLVLGSVFLTVTGGEALSADMGHFGRWPIQAVWLMLVLPCLAVNYLGQGAFALQHLAETRAAGQPFGDVDWFFDLIPPLLRIPMVVLATAATVIASQAVITGAFSLTQQAIRLGFLPRLETRNTSASHAGQIYLPTINRLLMIAVLLLVFVFKSSAALGDAYGLAVTGTMAVTTSLAFIITRHLWKWPLWLSVAFVGPLFLVDLVFLSANALKIPTGGWLPLSIAGALLLAMRTWRRGSQLVGEKLRRDALPMAELLPLLQARPPHRVSGTAVFLSADPESAPVALLHNLKHNKVLHERNILLTVRTAATPRVNPDRRFKTRRLADDFSVVVASFGFMEQPQLARALQTATDPALRLNMMASTFYLGRRNIVPSNASSLPSWQGKLYGFLVRNSEDPSSYFSIPPGRVVEVGTQVSI